MISEGNFGCDPPTARREVIRRRKKTEHAQEWEGVSRFCSPRTMEILSRVESTDGRTDKSRAAVPN